MSYESEVHLAQMVILKHLLFVDELSFANLRKATGLESDAFNFHIKQLICNGYVIKRSPGRYSLTKNGKTYANRMDTDNNIIEKQPKLSVVIIVKNKEGKHLFQQRLKQPYFNYWGHPTGKIRWGETVIETAERELLEETGLTANFEVVGIFHKLDYDSSTKNLFEDKYFYMVLGKNPSGDLRDCEGCHNEWLTADEFLQNEKRFGNIIQTEKILSGDLPNIVEQKYYYSSEDY